MANQQWVVCSDKSEESSALVAGAGNGDTRHDRIVRELQAWFPWRTMDQLIGLYIELMGGGRHRAAPTNTTRRFWTTEEHRQFLRGLRVYGRGEWKSISMNFVRSKTPVQVSSHAQKYFRRVESAAADKQCYSINDVGLNDDDDDDDAAAMDGTNSYSNNNFGGWQSLIQQQFMQMQAQTQQAWNDQHMMMAAAPMEGVTDTNFEPAGAANYYYQQQQQEEEGGAYGVPADQWMMNQNNNMF
ncbi:transcription factor DIVARICATA-like [Oryza glaberrima]|uniref:transcription factor DIVARICATA-like n=1 Tax=Oryza glaberrima TaxID=4538 RepID=UPI00224BF699|nr:transcription factor DIVARICATA-like [Oryza glaberrima]